MLKIKTYGHNYHYEILELVKVFGLSCEIINCDEIIKRPLLAIKKDGKDIDKIESILLFKDRKILALTIGQFDGHIKKTQEHINMTTNVHSNNKRAKFLVKRGIFRLLREQLNMDLPWGILTGIRPTKLVHEMLKDKLLENEIINRLEEQYYIAEDKARLLLQIAKIEYGLIYPIDKHKVSLYISIPFCPSRCTYCSFPSNPLKSFGHLTDDYVEALIKEIQLTSKIKEISMMSIDSLYIGGGTPTSLSSSQIEKILKAIRESFDLSELREFTFEAGRPDTIDEEKLMLLRNNGITRLSINPQTMNDCTLKEINRNHTSMDIVDAYYMAKEVGFDNINMDIIIGLPNEDIKMVKNTMEKIKDINPPGVTVHTLAIKNASQLKEAQYEKNIDEAEIISMIELTQEYAKSMGLIPYYLYRQKHMVGNLENIGFSKPGYEGIYNIQIMEEKQTIISMGAGAISKIVFNDENRLERVENVKNLEHYLNRVEEMVERKRKAVEGILC